MADVGEERYLWRWADEGAGKPWEIGLWVPGFPVECDAMGEALPPGLLAVPGISYNTDPKHTYLLALRSTPQAWLPTVRVPFGAVLINGAGCTNETGQLGPQGYPQVLLHREYPESPLTLKVIHGNTNHNLTRLYTWFTAEERLHRYNAAGGWDLVG